jgi:V/A-type H+-transporting ATPase subunit G/H
MGRETVLKAIRDAENSAREIISNAESEASDIVTKARLSATEIIQSGRSNSESSSQGMISEARGVAEKEAKKVSKDGDSSINSIHDGSDGNRENAVKIVLDAFRTN